MNVDKNSVCKVLWRAHSHSSQSYVFYPPVSIQAYNNAQRFRLFLCFIKINYIKNCLKQTQAFVRSIFLFRGDPKCLRRYGDGLHAGRPVFDSHQWQAIFLYVTSSRSAPAPTQRLLYKRYCWLVIQAMRLTSHFSLLPIRLHGVAFE